MARSDRQRRAFLLDWEADLRYFFDTGGSFRKLGCFRTFQAIRAASFHEDFNGIRDIPEGSTNSLSGEGCLLIGKIPSLNWIPGLLMGKIFISGNILLPSLDIPIKVLCKLAWIEEITEGRDRCVMGIRFQEITKENQDEIMKYIIKIQMVNK